MLDDTEEVDRGVVCMRFGSAEKKAYSIYDSAFL
jgi:hypothetical protein